MQALWCDCIRYGLKCLVATVIARASTSHGSHISCQPCSLAVKNLPGVTCHYGWHTVWHLFQICEELSLLRSTIITWDGKRNGARSEKGCLGLVEWHAEVVCLNHLLRLTATDNVVKVCKECRASWDDAGEHLESSDEWTPSGDSIRFGAQS